MCASGGGIALLTAGARSCSEAAACSLGTCPIWVGGQSRLVGELGRMGGPGKDMPVDRRRANTASCLMVGC